MKNKHPDKRHYGGYLSRFGLFDNEDVCAALPCPFPVHTGPVVALGYIVPAADGHQRPADTQLVVETERHIMTTAIRTDYAYDFANAMNSKFRHEDTTFSLERGKKYDKVVAASTTGSSRHVFAFVVRATGDLVKAASWKAPQRDKDGLAVRYNLDREFDTAVEAADLFGGFLYKR